MRKLIFPILLLLASLGKASAQGCVLACNNLVQVSLDGSCEALITQDVIAPNADITCPGPKSIEVLLNGIPIPGSPLVTGDYIGFTLTVRITHNATGNSCWGSITVEDKLKPVLVCPTVTIPCNTQNLEPSNPAIGYAGASDNCDNSVALSFTDDTDDLPCTANFSAIITRTWVGSDNSGNTASCSQAIQLQRATLADVIFPPHRDDMPLPAVDCQNPDTDPNQTGEPTMFGLPVEGFCEMNVTHLDQFIGICDNSYKVLRTWTVFDWCVGQFLTHIQVIKVVDKTPPAFNCPAAFTVSTATYACNGTVTMPAVAASDNCSPANHLVVKITSPFGSINGNGGSVPAVPVGVHTFTYTATDNCGNSSSCTVKVTMKDLVPPVAVCDEETSISLTLDGTAQVNASTFDDGSVDNCGVKEMKVRRMANDCHPESPLADKVAFDCCDVGTTVKVLFRVSDASGNSNDCMVDVIVEDKIKPQITCPASKTFECFEDYANPDIAGKATATDNCGVDTLFFKDNTSISTCATGAITRTWTAADKAGRTGKCTQIITVTNSSPFGYAGITWPPDFTTYDCGATANPADLPQSPVNYAFPVIVEDACDQVGVTHTDLVVPIAAPACIKILRKWTVIDWCQYDPDHPDAGGSWSHTQIVKILDITPPAIQCPADLTLGAIANDCGHGQVTLSAVTATDCNPDVNFTCKVDLGNNGTIDYTKPGSNASDDFPFGIHKVSVAAEDGCGNQATCLFKITVRDGKKPNAFCINGLTVNLMQNGMIGLTPNLFDAGSYDNCTPKAILEFRIDPDTFYCQNVGTNIVGLFIKDQAGNEAKCETYVIIQDNDGVCNLPPTAAVVSGAITNEIGDEVEAVNVNLLGSNALPFLTGLDGQFVLPNIPFGKSYTLQPEKTNDPLNGVTTYDMVLIGKHILGLQKLDSPYKIIAADVNQSGTISTADVLEIRKLVLHINPEFPKSKAWRFVKKDFVFPNPQNPFASAFPEVYDLQNLNGNMAGANFYGVKMGDVNNSAEANTGNVAGETPGDRGEGEPFIFEILDKNFEPGEELTATFFPKNSGAVAGFQMTLDFDPAVLEFLEVPESTGFGFENIGTSLLEEGALPLSWADMGAGSTFSEKTLQPPGPAFRFRAKRAGRLSEGLGISSRFTKAEAYRPDGEVLKTVLQFQPSSQPSSQPSIHPSIFPNPSHGETTLRFHLPEAGEARLTVFDFSGKGVLKKSGSFEPGANSLVIRKEELPGGGVFAWRLETASSVAGGKLVME